MRKTYHLLFSALTAALFLLHAKSRVMWSAPFIGLMFMAAALLLADTAFRWQIRGRLVKVFKGAEHRKMSGITYGVCGVICAYLVGGANIAAVSAILLGVTDSTSGLVGVYFGRHSLPFNRYKSVEGTVVGCAAGLAIMSVWPGGWTLKMFMALTATTVEILPIPIDDNFMIPVFTAIMAVGYKTIIG